MKWAARRRQTFPFRPLFTVALLYTYTYLDKSDPHAVAVVVEAVVVVVLVPCDDYVGRREQLRRPLAQHRHGSEDWLRRHSAGKYVSLSRSPCCQFRRHTLGKYYPLLRTLFSGYSSSTATSALKPHNQQNSFLSFGVSELLSLTLSVISVF